MMKLNTKLSTLLAVLMFSLAFVFAGFALAASEDSENILESRILKVGAAAPDFSVETLDGKQFQLNEHLGKKPVLLFFWSFFCGPCREEMPSLQNVYSEVGQGRMEFVGINLDGKGLSKAISKYLEDSKLEFVPLFDELVGVQYKVADPYGVAGTPTAYIIDLEGKIAYAIVGEAEPKELKNILEGILSGS
ncbi:MAG: TlpA family protein disulfide reductase [Planctomycetota bacterium]|jgi:peroxiredoxin